MRRLSTSLLALAFAARATAHAPLALREAQAEARSHSPEVAELEARLRGAQLSADAASRVLRSNPTLSGTYAPGALAGHPEEHSWELALSQTLDLSGSWGPRGASARADRERVAELREGDLRGLDEAVAIAVADVAEGQRALARAERIAALEQIAADAAHEELAVGQGNQLDVDAADLALAAARAGTERVRGDLASARARLARLLGRESSADLAVQDLTEEPRLPVTVSIPEAVERAPAVHAADAELRAARLELATADRTVWPEVTVGAYYGHARRDIPSGSFQGPGGAGLSASWTDSEIGFRLGFPVPIFDRKQPERAAASARILEAEAQDRRARADVRLQVESAWAALQAAQKAFAELARTPQVVERELQLLTRSLRAGTLDAVARAVAMRNLQDAAATYDQATRGLRIAEARWERWAGAPP